MRRIQSKKHKIGTQEIGNMLSLSVFYYKRFALNDGIDSLLIFIKT